MQSTLRIERSSIRIRRTPGDFAMLFAGMTVLAVAGLLLWWQVWHTNRIYTGVTVAGVPVGGLTRAAAVDRLTEMLARYPLPALSVVYSGRQWPITGDHARVATDLSAAVNRAYLVGRQESLSDRIIAQLAAGVGAVDIMPDLVVDAGPLRETVDRIAAEVRRPARAPAQMGAVMVPGQTGIEVDVDATVQALVEALEASSPGQRQAAPLVVSQISMPEAVSTMASDTATATDTETAASAAAAPSLLLRDSRYGLEFALDPAALQAILISDNPPQADPQRLRALLENWAEQVYLAPRDARLSFDPGSGTVLVIQTSRPGRQLNVDASLVSVREALAAGQNPALLVVEPVAPAVDSNRVAEMGIRELVASGTSYFSGSSAERVRNIEIAAEKFEGVVIPPGGVFSFNEYVEDVSAANGFEDSLIIWGDRTAVGIGGGVCQVSTTVFRAAYNAGMPIVERYNHGYVVDWYGEPGLDATIFTPSVDFKFRNDTGAYLLIDPVVNGAAGTMSFNLYGTKPAREVYVSEPVIADRIPAPPPLYTVDSSVEPGLRKQVDWEKPGMTTTVTRTIVEGGATRTETLVSKYQPWRAVYLVGSEADLPAPVETDAPAETAASAETDAPAPETPASPPSAP